jgi:hypothetical protein
VARFGVAQNFTRGSRLRRESVRVGWSMSILRRRRLVCRALSEATLSADARLPSMLKPDGMQFGLWIHDHGSAKANGAPQCTARESR